MDNEIVFMGLKEAIIQGTTSGQKQKNLLAGNEILDMIPGIASGRVRVDPSKLEGVLNLIEYGLSIGKSVDNFRDTILNYCATYVNRNISHVWHA